MKNALNSARSSHAKKEDVPSIQQDTWQHTHGTDSHPTVASSSQETHPFDGRTFSTKPAFRPESRVFIPKDASLRRSHLFNPVKVASTSWSNSRVVIPKAVSPLRPQNWRVVLTSAIQFKSTLAQADDCPTSPQLKQDLSKRQFPKWFTLHL